MSTLAFRSISRKLCTHLTQSHYEILVYRQGLKPRIILRIRVLMVSYNFFFFLWLIKICSSFSMDFTKKSEHRNVCKIILCLNHACRFQLQQYTVQPVGTPLGQILIRGIGRAVFKHLRKHRGGCPIDPEIELRLFAHWVGKTKHLIKWSLFLWNSSFFMCSKY